MSRFDGDGEGIPWPLWESIVSNALGGRRGQAALAELESALRALPEPKLIADNLAANGQVCAVGAFIAHRRAQREGIDIAQVIEAMSAKVTCSCGHPQGSHEGDHCTGTHWSGERCRCDGYLPDEEDAAEAVFAGIEAGLVHSVAWHLAYLNDEQFYAATPEERYTRLLTFVQRAQGKPVEVT